MLLFYEIVNRMVMALEQSVLLFWDFMSKLGKKLEIKQELDDNVYTSGRNFKY